MSAICRLETQESHSMIQSGSKGLTTKAADGSRQLNSRGEDEMRYPSSPVRQGVKGADYSFLHLLFCSGPLQNSPYIGEGRLLSLLIQMLIPSRNILTDTSRNNA